MLLRESSFQEHKDKTIKDSSAASASSGLCMEEARQKLKEMEEGLRVALDIHKQCTADGIRYKVR